jgi:nitrite reductase (NADH) small subunit
VTADPLPVPTVEHRLGPVADIPLGEGRAFAVGGQAVAVFRPRGGGLHAVSAVCPHSGGPLADGQIDARVVVCPLHLNAFDLHTGRSRSGQPPLAVYRVREESGEVVVELPAP